MELGRQAKAGAGKMSLRVHSVRIAAEEADQVFISFGDKMIELGNDPSLAQDAPSSPLYKVGNDVTINIITFKKTHETLRDQFSLWSHTDKKRLVGPCDAACISAYCKENSIPLLSSDFQVAMRLVRKKLKVTCRDAIYVLHWEGLEKLQPR